MDAASWVHQCALVFPRPVYRSTLLRGIAPPMLYVLAVSAAVCLYQSVFQVHSRRLLNVQLRHSSFSVLVQSVFVPLLGACCIPAGPGAFMESQGGGGLRSSPPHCSTAGVLPWLSTQPAIPFKWGQQASTNPFQISALSLLPLQAGLLPTTFPDFRVTGRELTQLVALTSPALSLLLVFRTNASYERWDSARKMWGLVLNRSRDMVRQVSLSSHVLGQQTSLFEDSFLYMLSQSGGNGRHCSVQAGRGGRPCQWPWRRSMGAGVL